MHDDDVIVNYYEKNERVVNTAFAKVFIWMFIGLLVTGITAVATVMSPALLTAIFLDGAYIGLAIAEIILVILLSARLNRMSKTTAKVSFLLYSIVNGLTLSGIFMMYTFSSIASAFFITAGMFAVMGIYGYTTKSDLTKMGSILMMALIGLLIATVVEIFWFNNTFTFMIAAVGVLIFVGLTAYDIQKIKVLSGQMENDSELMEKFAIYGALMIYLDFINIFLKLLRLLGRNRRD